MTFKEFLASKNISESDFASKSATETAQLQNEYNVQVQKEINEKLSKTASKAELEAIKNQLEAMPKTTAITKLQSDVSEALEGLAQLKENTTPGNENKTFRESIKEALLAQKDAISKMKDDSGVKAKLTIKAVGSMTFSSNVTGSIGRTERESGFSAALRRTPILLDIMNTSTTNAKTFEWVEKTGHEGGVAMTAEGAVAAQGDWDLELFSQSAKKDTLIVTTSKEMLNDIDGMAKDIEEEVYEQIRLFTESQVLDGDGTGNNIVGLDANATAFVAGTFANTVAAANTMDAIRVAINQVELNNDYPTAVLMHPSDATAMELVKDATTKQYILPPFTTAGGTNVKGLPVRTSTVVTQGEAYVGNFNRFKVKVRENIELEMGYRGAQGDWEKGMVSFLGEQRFFAFIPAVHYGSIVKIDLTVAKALLDPSVADS